VFKKGSSRPCSSKVDGDGIGGPNSRAYVGSMGCNITGNLRSRLASFVTFVRQHHSFILEDFLYRLLFVSRLEEGITPKTSVGSPEKT
jgi:hypothetical protein